jgi:putative Mg2+ transporter-C (MgtC) family protein
LGEWSSELGVGAILLRIALAILLAAVIGCERSSKRHAAGLRTFILVALATSVSMMLDLFLSQGAATPSYNISAAAIIGIAIISINSILYSSKNQIKGLTTSVGLWACGIIGLCTGAGYYTVTAVSFAALLCSLSLFPTLEMYLKNRSNHFEIHIELKNPRCLQDFVTTIRKLGLTIDDIELNPAYVGSGLSVYSISISINSAELKKYKKHSEIVEALRTLDYIYHIEEID